MQKVVKLKPTPVRQNIPEFLGPETMEETKEKIKENFYPREKLANILLAYNKRIGNDEAAFVQIENLRDEGKFCVITGQQLGFMGGPSYTILKAISCVLAAKEKGLIPVFWLATEDHDVGEIDTTTLIDAKGNLSYYRLGLSKSGLPVEALQLSDGQLKVIDTFVNEVHCPFRSDETSYHYHMAQHLAKMFAGTGLVFVEPYLLRELAEPFFSRELADAEGAKSVLSKTTEALIKAGGEAPIRIGEGSNLFYFNSAGKRNKVKGNYKGDLGRLSANVCLRPVVQNGLFPTLGYVGGESEIAYHHQLKDYHAFHGLTMPTMIPRLSVTPITEYVQGLLSTHKIDPWDIPPQGFHYLENYFSPKGELPERVFNWWAYQRTTSVNLIGSMLEHLDWKERGHHYCYL